MRNGNYKTPSFILTGFFSSYRTYEEWKLRDYRKKYSVDIRSYRTYEEWKHENEVVLVFEREGFLPYL